MLTWTHRWRRNHQDTAVQRLVKETYQQLLFSSQQSVQTATFETILAGCTEEVSSWLPPESASSTEPDARPEASLVLEPARFQPANRGSFEKDAELLQAAVAARPEAFAAPAFDLLASVALEKGVVCLGCMLNVVVYLRSGQGLPGMGHKPSGAHDLMA